MNDYRREQRLHRRGDYCIAPIGMFGLVCGCGTRTPPTKRQTSRIVRRSLDRELKSLIKETEMKKT